MGEGGGKRPHPENEMDGERFLLGKERENSQATHPEAFGIENYFLVSSRDQHTHIILVFIIVDQNGTRSCVNH